MRAKLVVVAIAVFVLCGLASAQSYFIQTNARINLRSWYSTNSRIVETVPSGTALQVVGNFNRWLKINRNGREVWMADWVPYTRLQTGDNLCFTVRTCRTDEEWAAGYYAFHGLHQPSAPASPPSQPAEIDNLCFTVRTCRTDEEWAAGYYAFHGLQPSAPARSQSQPRSQVTYVINCTHARELGIAPVHRGEPAYRRALDRDNDGIGCE